MSPTRIGRGQVLNHICLLFLRVFLLLLRLENDRALLILCGWLQTAVETKFSGITVTQRRC